MEPKPADLYSVMVYYEFSDSKMFTIKLSNCTLLANVS